MRVAVCALFTLAAGCRPAEPPPSKAPVAAAAAPSAQEQPASPPDNDEFCNGARALQSFDRPPEVLHLGNVEALIVPERNAAAVLCPHSRSTLGPGTAYWTPVFADIADLEQALPDLVKARGCNRCDLDRSRRQYLGVIRGKQRTIYVNFFSARGPGPDWETRVVVVFDGGAAYFGIEYDVTGRKIIDVQFNGEA